MKSRRVFALLVLALVATQLSFAHAARAPAQRGLANPLWKPRGDVTSSFEIQPAIEAEVVAETAVLSPMSTRSTPPPSPSTRSNACPATTSAKRR
jgi:hypothetical protein